MKYGDRLTVLERREREARKRNIELLAIIGRLERETDLLRNQVRAMFFRMNEIGEKNEDHRGVGSAD